jgi:hypothetical protein
MKKISLLISIVFIFHISGRAQYSIGGGYSIYKSLGAIVTWQGLHGFVEIPRSESNTFFLRMTGMFPQKNSTFETMNATAYEFATSPQQIPVDVERLSKVSFISIDGGNRTYFNNTYDAGVSLYFSSYARGIFGTSRSDVRVSEFDDVKYQSPVEASSNKANSVFLGMGANIGVKYQLPYRGAIMFDIGAEYVLGLYDAAGFFQYGELSQISFFANLSYRFDWY